MGSIWLYTFCPLKSPQRAVSAFGGTSLSGEKEKWKRWRGGECQKGVRCANTCSFTHIYPLGSQKCHIVNHCLIWKLYCAKCGSALGDAPPTGWGQQQRPNSICKQGPQFSSNSQQSALSHVGRTHRHH